MTDATAPSRNDREANVARRYSAAAQAQEPSLCCPVRYRREFLDVVPREILDRDYGCGDPTPYVHEGETVLDLGSGGGKVCYIPSQGVGSMTVIAHKGKQGPCFERNQTVVYRGPFKKVEDDDDHVYYRGRRMAVCDKTFRLLQREPYAGHFEYIEPRERVPLEAAERFDCSRPKHRHPRETKGLNYDATTESQGTCTENGNCC